MTIPSAIALISFHFSQPVHGKMYGLWKVFDSPGAFLGTLLATLALIYLTWRFALIFSLPIALIGGYFVMTRISETPCAHGKIFSWTVIPFAILLLSLIVLSIDAPVRGVLSTKSGILLLVIILSAIAFQYLEAHSAVRLFPDRLMHNKKLIAGALGLSLFGTTAGCILFFTPLYIRNILMASHLILGIFLASIPIAAVVGALLSALFSAQYSKASIFLITVMLSSLSIACQLFFVHLHIGLWINNAYLINHTHRKKLKKLH